MIPPKDANRPVRRALALALVALTLFPSTACTGADPAALAVTAPEMWFASYHDALRQGVFNTRSHYADDALVDLSSLGFPAVTGSAEGLQVIGRAFVPFRDRDHEQGDLYVSGTGAVEAAPIQEPFGDANRLVAINEFGPGGITSQTFAVSELAWRAGRTDDPRMLARHLLARDWAHAWSTGSASALEALYVPTATLTDDLMGVGAQSRAEVVAHAAEDAEAGGSPQFSIDLLPGLSGPATYVVASAASHYVEPMQAMVMLVTASEGEGCPGHLAVVVELDEQGRITHESRYHRVDTLARCVQRGARTTGAAGASAWWEDLAIPPPVARVQSGVLSLNGADVLMFNSTPHLDRLVVWASGRFDAVGLKPPTLTEVAFYDNQIDLCRNVRGLALGASLSLCFLERTACTDPGECTDWREPAKATALHELGHAWMAGLPKQTQQAFTAQGGQAGWADTADLWGERGVELAAETIAWALMDEPYTVNPQLGVRTCPELGTLFEILTGKALPGDVPCPAQEAPTSQPS